MKDRSLHLVERPGGRPSPTLPASANEHRLRVLDGWRALSILFVLATHMLPLGPHGWGNSFLGIVGMSLFFTLSGFLITTSLLERPDVPAFIVRRGCRILPLALLYATVALSIQHAVPAQYFAHYLFFTNYDTSGTGLTSHFWSLCVEIHFYAFIAILVAVGGRRSLILLPVICVAVTAVRVAQGKYISIETHSRVDEILAGAWLALVHSGRLNSGVTKGIVSRVPQPLLAMLLVLCSYPSLPAMNYLRPYCAAALVGSTIWRTPNGLHWVLSSAPLRYVATISYALYVVHKITMFGWLGTGSLAVRYLCKRPISFVLTFGLAHLSTFYYERWWISLGKRLTGSQHVRRAHETATKETAATV